MTRWLSLSECPRSQAVRKTEMPADSVQISQTDPTHWKKLYKAAMLESDAFRVNQRIETALWAIAQRSLECEQNRIGTVDERHEIAEAVSSLEYWKKFISAYCVHENFAVGLSTKLK
jgi:hypothetical protein